MTSPTFFNGAVDSVVQNWMSITVEDDTFIYCGLVHVVGSIMGVFYADDGPIGLRYLEWVLGGINVLIGLFRRIGLIANVS